MQGTTIFLDLVLPSEVNRQDRVRFNLRTSFSGRASGFDQPEDRPSQVHFDSENGGIEVELAAAAALPGESPLSR